MRNGNIEKYNGENFAKGTKVLYSEKPGRHTNGGKAYRVFMPPEEGSEYAPPEIMRNAPPCPFDSAVEHRPRIEAAETRPRHLREPADPSQADHRSSRKPKRSAHRSDETPVSTSGSSTVSSWAPPPNAHDAPTGVATTQY